MSEKNNLSLKDMYDNLKQEADDLEIQLKKNLLRISEIDEYLDSLLKTEDADFKVFSPWNVEHIHKENIDNKKTEKYELESDNRIIYSKLNKIHSYLSVLDDIKEKDSGLKILEIQENERHRIARDLHDTSLQNLAHLVHKIELASMYIDKDTLQAKLELASINNNLKLVIEEIRNTIFDLRPMSFDDLGLKETLERLFYKLKEMNRSFDFDIHIEEIKSNDNTVLINIFRMVQEASQNAIKHSGGNKLKVDIYQRDNICYISVKDNGDSFSIEEVFNKKGNHFGIAIMKERVNLLGGEIHFDSIEDSGTEVRITIPL